LSVGAHNLSIFCLTINCISVYIVVKIFSQGIKL
jgi:hypothetical protein